MWATQSLKEGRESVCVHQRTARALCVHAQLQHRDAMRDFFCCSSPSILVFSCGARLHRLHLKHNNIKGDGIKAIAKAILGQCAAQYISLWGNPGVCGLEIDPSSANVCASLLQLEHWKMGRCHCSHFLHSLSFSHITPYFVADPRFCALQEESALRRHSVHCRRASQVCRKELELVSACDANQRRNKKRIFAHRI